MKLPKIGIHYKSLEHIGGIERVVSELARIFSTSSEYVSIITEEPILFLKDRIKCDVLLLDSANREASLSDFIKNNQIEWLIFNDPSHQHIEEDIATSHNINCKVALIIHFSFPSPIYFTEASKLYSRVVSVGKLVDALACVSEMDAYCWGSLGIKTYHVQNPFVHSEPSETITGPSSNSIIWVGRGSSQKKPFSAIDIMELVIRKVPDARLKMIGVGPMKKDLLNYAKDKHIDNNIEIISETNNVGQYYAQAKIHLLTSVTESFCLVIAEAKQFGLPTVMYSIPFLELIETRKGVCVHELNDNVAMADSIIKLFNDDTLYKSMHEEALESLKPFNDSNVIKSWRNLFNDKKEYQKNNAEEGIAELIKAWNLFVSENWWKLDFCENIDKIIPFSLQKLAGKFLSAIQKVKLIKRRLK